MVTSRYAELEAPQKFVFREEELAVSGNQVLVRVLVSGLCMYELNHYLGVVGEYPKRLGHEPTGIVEAVGPDVTEFKPGDRVTGLFQLPGVYQLGFATYAIGYSSYLVHVPYHIPLHHALGEPLKCVGTILRAAPPEFGDHVLVMGCGFMGLLILAGLVGRGLETIIVADVNNDRLVLAAEIGATVTLNPTECDFPAEVARITRGRGVDVVFEAAGKKVAVEWAAQTLRRGRGRFVLAGWHGIPEVYNLRMWTKVGAIVVTPHPTYSLDPMDDLRRAMDGLARGVFPMEKLVTHQFPLDDIQEAFEIMRRGADGYIKGVILPWGHMQK